MTGAKVKLVLLVLLTIILGIAIFQQRSYSNHERHFKIVTTQRILTFNISHLLQKTP